MLAKPLSVTAPAPKLLLEKAHSKVAGVSAPLPLSVRLPVPMAVRLATASRPATMVVPPV